MTFCLGIKINEGLVALADSRVVKGDERVSKAKLEIIRHGDRPVFVMTSGLRAVRDKAMIYLKERLEQREAPFGKLYQIANEFGACLRVVRDEDGDALARDGLQFNTHAIIGGCMEEDKAPGLLYLYPTGNWIEASIDSPYFIIGRSPYGKPILDRLLKHDIDLSTAVNLGFLAFDATRTSVTDVDYPLDIVTVANHGGLRRKCFLEDHMHELSTWWRRCLAASLAEMPSAWAAELIPEPDKQEPGHKP